MTVKRLSLLVAMAVAVISTPFVRAQTMPLDDAKLQAVQDQCQDIQKSIIDTQQSDKLARINRGHIYETTLQLLVNFNARVISNKVDAPELLTITGDYQTERKKFSELYTKYDDSITALVAMDCKPQPTEFYEKLTEIRTQRSQLNASVAAIDSLIEKYESIVKSIRQQFPSGDKNS